MDTGTLARRLASGDRRALAKAITLVESQNPAHRAAALALMRFADDSGRSAFRIGLSGTPGVGKSSFIERFGLMLLESGVKLAVLAIDPSSARSGGSILGDKTRMAQLSRAENCFIRPSPNQTSLGGVARRSREAIRLCELWGADIVLLETVGVGQSETMVADMVDLFALLMAPAGGDELQGVKRGVMERADMILVNKADGDLAALAQSTCADYAGALRLLRKRGEDPADFPKAMTLSAHSGAGIAEAWAEMQALRDWRQKEGWQEKRRSAQQKSWFRAAMESRLETLFGADEAAQSVLQPLQMQLETGEIDPEHAADQAINRILAQLCASRA